MANYVYTAAESLHYGTLIFDLISKGTLKIKIHKEYEFSAEGARAAQSDLVGGRTVGKLVLKVSDL